MPLVAWSAIVGVYSLLQVYLLCCLRCTVSGKTLFRTVLVGLYGCTVVALPIQLLSIRLLGALGASDGWTTASYSIDPLIEEVLKVLPVILIARFVGPAMGLADFIILGASAGLGFGFTESWLRLTRGIEVDAYRLADLIGWVPYGRGVTGSIVLRGIPHQLGVASHMIWTAIAGFAVGAGRKLGTSRKSRWGIAIVGIGLMAFDHAMSNLSIENPAFFSNSGGLASETLKTLYGVLSFGKATPYLLLVVIVLAFWWDGKQISRALARDRSLLLEYERNGPSPWAELGLLFSSFSLDQKQRRAARLFLRLRRQIAYAEGSGVESGYVDANGVPSGQVDATGVPPGHVERLRNLALESRIQIDSDAADTQGRKPPNFISRRVIEIRLSVQGFRGFLRNRQWKALKPFGQLLLSLAFVLVYVLGTTRWIFASPDTPVHWLSSPVGTILFLIAAVISIDNLRQFRRAPKPDNPDSDVQAQYRLRGILVYSLVGVAATALYAGLQHGVSDFIFSGGGGHLPDASKGAKPGTIVSGMAAGADESDRP